MTFVLFGLLIFAHLGVLQAAEPVVFDFEGCTPGEIGPTFTVDGIDLTSSGDTSVNPFSVLQCGWSESVAYEGAGCLRLTQESSGGPSDCGGFLDFSSDGYVVRVQISHCDFLASTAATVSAIASDGRILAHVEIPPTTCDFSDLSYTPIVLSSEEPFRRLRFTGAVNSSYLDHLEFYTEFVVPTAAVNWTQVKAVWRTSE